MQVIKIIIKNGTPGPQGPSVVKVISNTNNH
jgi:hypothetical protein